jgi:hypothetical protein
MFVKRLCPPALLYLGFSLAQIFVDTLKGLYNTAFFKFVVMIVFTIILNILCSHGLSVISWLIVFIPFIVMTFITSLLLFVFDLSPGSGKTDKFNVSVPSVQQLETDIHNDVSSIRHELDKVGNSLKI